MRYCFDKSLQLVPLQLCCYALVCEFLFLLSGMESGQNDPKLFALAF